MEKKQGANEKAAQTQQSNHNPFRAAYSLYKRVPVGWRIAVLGITGFIALLSFSIFHPYMTERIKFATANTLNLLIFLVVIIQAVIYRRQWEIMQAQIEIASIAVKPRLRIANVRAINFAVGGLPVFIVSLINEGATEARSVEIKLQLQRGDETPIFWTRQQDVTIPANGKEDYPIRWPSVLRREDIDGFNDNVSLRVLGYFIHENTTVEFCYRYYPWPFGKRPDGLPQFFHCGFDPGLTITMNTMGGTFTTAGSLTNLVIRGKSEEKKEEEPN